MCHVKKKCGTSALIVDMSLDDYFVTVGDIFFWEKKLNGSLIKKYLTTLQNDHLFLKQNVSAELGHF